jgi:SAM-dependent methyltransferase
VSAPAFFGGSVPEYYDRCLGPAWFGPFAAELARRIPAIPPGPLLEIACGTGLASRPLRARLDPAIRMVSSDLSPAMLEHARSKQIHGIEWQQADASALSFGDGEFGAVACALGFMFVPDKPKAFSEARRVLRSGGTLAFSVWDRVEDNPTIGASASVLRSLAPDDPEMRFETPYLMHDIEALRALVVGAGFADPVIDRFTHQIEGVTAKSVATGLLRGTPRAGLLKKRGVDPDMAIEKLTRTLAELGGDAYRSRACAIMVQARAA